MLCLLLLYDLEKKDYRTFQTKLTVQSVPTRKSLIVDALGLVVPSQWIEPKSDGDSFAFFACALADPIKFAVGFQCASYETGLVHTSLGTNAACCE